MAGGAELSVGRGMSELLGCQGCALPCEGHTGTLSEAMQRGVLTIYWFLSIFRISE